MRPIFSDNFIVIDANHNVQDAFDLFSKISPDYVIVSRQVEKKNYHYVFLTKLLKDYLDSCLRSNKNPWPQTLMEFLYLHGQVL